MTPRAHKDQNIQRLHVGRENAPLVVIDQVLAEPEQMVDLAAGKVFAGVINYYPGVRAKAPLTYVQFILETCSSLFSDFFGFGTRTLRMTQCHFSMVATPPQNLTYLQSIPHVDSYATDQLAFVHYLFKKDLGGTAFYRHRRTGFEYIDEERRPRFTLALEEEMRGPDCPKPGYIDGDTALYEQIGRQEGVFNRLLLYRRNSLHSGCIRPDFVPDPNPRTGRLTLTGFLA